MSARMCVRPRGPLMVEGDFKVVDANGNELPLEPGAKVALCRCGASRRRPFCDGSHHRVRFEVEEAACSSE